MQIKSTKKIDFIVFIENNYERCLLKYLKLVFYNVGDKVLKFFFLLTRSAKRGVAVQALLKILHMHYLPPV